MCLSYEISHHHPREAPNEKMVRSSSGKTDLLPGKCPRNNLIGKKLKSESTRSFTDIDTSEVRRNESSDESMRVSHDRASVLFLRKKSSILQPSNEKVSRKSVSFGHVYFREHNCILGDNPSCSIGPPLGLGWEYIDQGATSLDEYEFEKLARTSYRKDKQNRYLSISMHHRKNILLHCCGYSEEQLIKATKKVEKVQFQRWLTTTFLPTRKLEEGIESAGRKIRRIIEKYVPSNNNKPFKRYTLV